MGLFNFLDKKNPTNHHMACALKERGWSESNDNYLISNHIFSIPESTSNVFDYKHILMELIQRAGLSCIPKTYILDDDNALKMIHHIMSQEQQNTWILKPAKLNNGEGIKIFGSSKALLSHYQQNNRYAGPHILQAYIDPPHLLNGHKYSLRFFVILTNYCGHYLFKEGYFNICRSPYMFDDFSNMRGHLSNEHLDTKRESNTYQIPTKNCQHFDSVFRDVLIICKELVQAFKKNSLLSFENNTKQMAILGLDFMLDGDLNTFFLEANHGACFATTSTHPLYESVYRPLFLSIVDNLITPHFGKKSNKHPLSNELLRL